MMYDYISEIGIPLPEPIRAAINYQYPKELLKDDSLDGFKAPYPLKFNPLQHFSLFGLWHSTSGVNTIGKDVTVMAMAGKAVITLAPILVGDRVNSSYVWRVEAERYRGHWKSYLALSKTPPPKQREIAEEPYAYLKGLHDTLVAIQEQSNTLVGEVKAATNDLCKALFDSLASAMVTTSAPSGSWPLLTAASQPAFSTGQQSFALTLDNALKSFNNELDNTLEELKKLEWIV
jgi:hypothetical protein